MLTGLLSLLALKQARESSASDAVLKGAAILYPRVACWALSRTIKELTERIGAGLTSRQQRALRACFVTTQQLDPQFTTFYESEAVIALDKWSENRSTIDTVTLDQLVQELLDAPHDRKRVHELISLYISVRLNCPYHAHPVEASRFARLFGSTTPTPSDDRPLTFALPDLDELSWADIVDLRRSPYVDQFRLFISTFYLKNSAEVEIKDAIVAALWEAAGFSKPSKSGSAIERVIGQVPIPLPFVPNPYSVYRDLKDGIKEARLFKNYGWLWFIQEAKSLTTA